LGVWLCYLVFHKDFTFHFLFTLKQNAPGEILISYRDDNGKSGSGRKPD
jgi:hypothetical protein